MYPLIAKWAILPGKEAEAIAALKKMAADVQKNEPDTLLYMVHVPDFSQKSLPVPPNGEVVFMEIYRDEAAFQKHVTGPVLTGFIEKHGKLFLTEFSTPPKVFMMTEILTQIAGFARHGV